MRLLKAVSLLRDPDAKIINIAEQCGFSHLGLFNTCFKKRLGCSPGKWRKCLLTPKPQPGDGGTEDSACPLGSQCLCFWTGTTAHAVAPVVNLRKKIASAVLSESPRVTAGNVGLCDLAGTISPIDGKSAQAVTGAPTW